MHEMALAEGVVVTALESARREGRPILRLNVKVGQLQQIETDILRHCLDGVLPKDEPLLAGMQVLVDLSPACLRCRLCRHDFRLDDLESPPDSTELEAIHFVPELAHSYIKCPGCGSPDFEVVSGRGVWIESMELEPGP